MTLRPLPPRPSPAVPAGAPADAPAAAPAAAQDAAATTRDSLTVAAGTALSRASGLVRVAVVAAVLGPTFLGNTYQFTNSVPNLIYYGLLGGSLVSSLLVPAMVAHLGRGDRRAAADVASGFLGTALVATLVVCPVAAAAVPFLLRVHRPGTSEAVAQAQASAATWLIVLLIPQLACYAVIACCVAVMNAHRRFALAAAAPLVENVGSIVVLGIVAVVYGTGREVTEVGTGQLVTLGAGTTLAVASHAAVQLWGARRAAGALRPTAGWRDGEVRTVLRRAGVATMQAGMWSVQLLVMLVLANRVPGGVVAMLIAMNFFFLPIALGAAPVGLASLPRLAGHQAGERQADYDAGVLRALRLTVFVTAPAVAGYLVLAPLMSSIVAFGTMNSDYAVSLLTVAIGAVALGIVGNGVFMVATYASYARSDARAPLRAMAVQATLAVVLMAVAIPVDGRNAILLLGLALSAASLTGAVLLVRRVCTTRRELALAAARTAACSLVMAGPVWLTSRAVRALVPERGGQVAALAAAIAVGLLTYATAQRLSGAPELTWFSDALRRRSSRQPTDRAVPEASAT